MDSIAVAGMMEAIAASALQMAAVLRGTPVAQGDGTAVDTAVTGPAAVLSTTGPAAGPSTTGPSAAALSSGQAGLPVNPAGGDPLRWQADACLTVLSGIAGMESMFAAVKVHTAVGYDDAAQGIAGPVSTPAEQTAQDRAIATEVACALTVSERTGNALLGESHRLTTALPLTLAALEAGTLSWQHARIMVDETTSLDPAGARALEAHFLDPEDPNAARGCPAGDLVPGRFRAKARTWRERHHPVSIEKRHTRCAADRRVEYSPDRDGMAWLSAYLPADTASGIWERTTTAARELQNPTEARTLTQLRADIAATLLLGGGPDAGSLGAGSLDAGSLDDLPAGPGANTTAGENRDPRAGVPSAPGSAGAAAGENLVVREGVPSPRAQVLVTVPVFALMGLTEEPAILDGHGPIPPSMARRLIADGAESFHRVLVDPRDGAPLEIGRSSYRVTKAMRQWLRLRDGKCPFPGCNNPSLDNDADHLLAWADGGPTGITNLGQPCRSHHRLKHTTAWQPTEATINDPPGWISPAGRHYQSEHPDHEPPTWPGNTPWDYTPQGGYGLPEDPFPGLSGHVVRDVDQDRDSFPLSEDDLPDYVLFPDDSLPDRPLPRDPLLDWASMDWTSMKWAVKDSATKDSAPAG